MGVSGREPQGRRALPEGCADPRPPSGGFSGGSPDPRLQPGLVLPPGMGNLCPVTRGSLPRALLPPLPRPSRRRSLGLFLVAVVVKINTNCKGSFIKPGEGKR